MNLWAQAPPSSNTENPAEKKNMKKNSKNEYLSFLRNYPLINTEEITTNICIVKIWVLMSASLNYPKESGYFYDKPTELGIDTVLTIMAV